jgi:RecA-family ATPase
MGFKYKSGASKRTEFNPDDAPLPPSVQEYLDGPVPEGGRNRALFNAAGQFRDIGESKEEALALLGSKAMRDGLPESEVRTCIESAYNQPPREAPRAKGKSASPRGGGRRVSDYTLKRGTFAGSKPEQVAPVKTLEEATPMTVPAPIEEDGFESFLLAAFEEGEGVCLSRGRELDDGTIAPDVGVTLEREKWLERVRRKGDVTKVESTKLGLYVRMNPLKPLSKRNLNEDVTAFRHVLVEFDTDANGETIPKEKQFGMMLASDLPITAIIDSGNKSLHAWVRVDAEDAEQYRERAEKIYSLFPDVDEQNHNPNRLSRAPDGFRTVNNEVRRQRLLKLNVGAQNFEAWEALNEAKTQGEGYTLDELLAYDVENDPNTVIGQRWLCKNGSLVIVAPSGVGKSALTSQLSLGWSIARNDLTFGIEPIKPLRQLILQAENDKGDLAEGLQGIIKGAKLSTAERRKANENLFFRRITTLTGEAFLHAVEGFVQLHRPDICWIDPLLNFIGDDASKQEVIARFCVEGLNTIGHRTGTIFALIHHTAKPKTAADKKGQTATDLAYAGFGSSGLTNWAREVMVLDRVEVPEGEPPTFTLTACKRRLRAGMKTMTPDEDGAPMDGQPTAQIYIRHSTDRIAWVQCPKPESEEDEKPRGRRGAKRGDDSNNPKGRPSSLTDAQRLDIADAVNANGGDPRIGPEATDALARKIGKHPRSVQRYLNEVAERAAKAREELIKEGAIKS